MLSLASKKTNRQNCASPKGWCCRHNQIPHSAYTPSYDTIRDFCPCLARFYHTLPQDFATKDLKNHQWHGKGVGKDRCISDYPLPTDLNFNVYPIYSNDPGWGEGTGHDRDTGSEFARSRPENSDAGSPRFSTSSSHARSSSTSERVQEIARNINFRAAAAKLYSVLTRTDQFLYAFLRNFQ